jgi:hypothetical protein
VPAEVFTVGHSPDSSRCPPVSDFPFVTLHVVAPRAFGKRLPVACETYRRSSVLSQSSIPSVDLKQRLLLAFRLFFCLLVSSMGAHAQAGRLRACIEQSAAFDGLTPLRYAAVVGAPPTDDRGILCACTCAFSQFSAISSRWSRNT